MCARGRKKSLCEGLAACVTGQEHGGWLQSAPFLESLFLQQRGTNSPGWWLLSFGKFSFRKKAKSKVYHILMAKDDADV